MLFLLKGFVARPQHDSLSARIEFFGQVATDIGYNCNQIDSAWFDVVRPTKLPAYKNEFAPNGNVYFSIRQSSFGFDSHYGLPRFYLIGKFDFDLYGTGTNAGQTAVHFKEAYVEYKKLAVGQMMTPFMDIDVAPEVLEYWGPPSRVFLRNIMIRYTPLQGESHISLALEKPGASADEGIYRSRVELRNVRSQFVLPNLSIEYRTARPWGYVELAGLLQFIKWVDTSAGPYNLGGHALTWGLNASSNVHLGDANLVQAQVVFGKGIENYATDATADIGIKKNFTNPTTPILGVALPFWGSLLFLKHHWTNRLTSVTSGL